MRCGAAERGILVLNLHNRFEDLGRLAALVSGLHGLVELTARDISYVTEPDGITAALRNRPRWPPEQCDEVEGSARVG